MIEEKLKNFQSLNNKKLVDDNKTIQQKNINNSNNKEAIQYSKVESAS